MTLPRISLDPANPDSLYTGAQKINQVIEATENHIHATTQKINQVIEATEDHAQKINQVIETTENHAQRINQVIETTENHIHATNNPHQVTADQIGAETPAGAQAKVEAHVSDDMPHRATDPSTGKVYRWGLTIQSGEWGIIYEEVV